MIQSDPNANANTKPKDEDIEGKEENLETPDTAAEHAEEMMEDETPIDGASFADSLADSLEEDGIDMSAMDIDPRDTRIQELEDQLDKTKEAMLRAIAEAENTRKRMAKQAEDAKKYAVSSFAKDLLDFSDNFRRALTSIPEDLKEVDERIAGVLGGIEAMEKDFLRTLEKNSITKIEPMGEPFDPNFHEVMFEAPGTGQPAGIIIELIEPGYMLGERLLRPARVGVAKDEGQGSGESPHKVDTEA